MLAVSLLLPRLLAACTGGAGNAFELTVTPVLARNQSGLLDELDRLDLVLLQDGEEVQRFEIGGLEQGDSTTLEDVDALSDVTLRLEGFVGNDVVAAGQTEPRSLDADPQEVEILLAQLDAMAELAGLTDGRAFGALASDGAGRFFLFGGSQEAVYPDDDLSGTILALDISPPSTGLLFEELDLTLPPLDSGAAGRIGATATLLSQGGHDHVGRILVAGGTAALHYGESAGGGVSYSADLTTVDSSSFLFDPDTDTIQDLSESAALNRQRAFHTAHELPTGDVVVIGGFGSATQGTFRAQQTAEIYNPTVGAFEVADGDPTGPFLFHAAATLGDDGVLVCGGLDITTWDASDECDLVSRAGAISDAGQAPEALIHSAMAPLPDGRILLAGGVRVDSPPSYMWYFGDVSTVVSDAWIFDGSQWSTADSMAIPRAMHSMVSLPNGDVLVAGGVTAVGDFWDLVFGGEFAIPCAELYDSTTGRFRVLGDQCDVDAQIGALTQSTVAPAVAADPTFGALVVGGVALDETGAKGADLYVYPSD